MSAVRAQRAFKVAAELNPSFIQDHVAHDNPADKYY
jgi:hypothetical protein